MERNISKVSIQKTNSSSVLRITIPKHICEYMKLGKGDYVEFVKSVINNREVIIIKIK